MKKTIIIAAASVITILSACILVRTNVRNDEDFFTANVEALAQDPDGEAGPVACYNDIHKKDGCGVWYCSHCIWLDDSTCDAFARASECLPL